MTAIHVFLRKALGPARCLSEPRSNAATILAVVWISAAACVDSDTDGWPAGAASRDSAGIAIIEPTDSTWRGVDRWHLNANSELDIGTVGDGPIYAFSSIRGALRLSDGTIVVADGGSSELRFFGPDGMHRLTVGREGEGPGEFRAISAVHRLAGDSVVVFDSRLRRFSVFDKQGVLSRTGAINAPDWQGRITAVAWIGSKFFVGYQEPTSSQQQTAASYLGVGRVVLFETTGAVAAELELHMPVWGAGPAGQDRPVIPRVLPMFAGDADGFWFALPYRYELTHYSSAGLIDRILRPKRHVQLLNEATKRAMRSHLADRLRMPNLPAEMQRTVQWGIDNIVVRDSVPAFEGVIVDAEGNLWIQEFADIQESTDIASWPFPGRPPLKPARTVYSADGQWLGTIPFPAGFLIHDIGIDYVLGVSLHEATGVELIRLYQLVRPQDP